MRRIIVSNRSNSTRNSNKKLQNIKNSRKLQHSKKELKSSWRKLSSSVYRATIKTVIKLYSEKDDQ